MPSYKTKYSSRFGGDGGHEFTDTDPDLGGRGKISQIFIRSGSKVDKITTVFANGTSISNGGDGGSVQPEINLADDEYVTSVQLRCGEKLDQITFITNKDHYGPFGGSGGHTETFTFPEGSYLQYFAGRCGESIDAISFAYGDMLPKKDVKIIKLGSKGSANGDNWDDLASLKYILHAIQKISIQDNGSHVSQIAVTYTTGSATVPLSHGGGSSKRPDFVLNSSEYVTQVDFYTSGQVNGLQFTLNSGRKSIWYGNRSGDTHSIKAPSGSCIAAFYGRTDDRLHALGVFTANRVPVKVVVSKVDFESSSFETNADRSGSLTTAQLTNNTDIDQVVSESHSFTYETSSTTTLENSWSSTVQISFEAGTQIEKESVSLSFTAGQTFTNGTTVTTTVTDTYTFNVSVPARATVYGECFASYYKSRVRWTGKADVYYNFGEPDLNQDISGYLDDVDVADVKASYHQL